VISYLYHTDGTYGAELWRARRKRPEKYEMRPVLQTRSGTSMRVGRIPLAVILTILGVCTSERTTQAQLASARVGLGFNTMLSSDDGLGFGFRTRIASPVNADLSFAFDLGVTGFVVEGVTPGYNDTAVRSGNRPTGRYYTGDTIADAGDVFTDLIDQAAIPHLDDDADRLLLVNSFNEWHEDTQIETSVVTAPSSVDDSASGTQFTQGVTYEGYGTKYLDLLRLHTTPGAPLLLDGDADFDGDLDADDPVAFAAAWGSENLVDGVRTGGYESRIARPDFNYDGVVDFQDWFIMRDAHPTTSDATLAALLAAPEPSAWVSCCAIALVTFSRGARPQRRCTLFSNGGPTRC